MFHRLALLVLLAGTNACPGSGSAGEPAPPPGEAFEVLLDFRPMEDPVSTLVSLSGNDRLSVVRYSPYLFEVRSIREGEPRSGMREKIGEMVSDPDIREALRRRDYTGEGLIQGDQFRLRIEAGDGLRGECLGFVHRAPEVVGGLVKKLLASGEGIRDVSPAAAYLRSEPIPTDRFEKLRQRGKVRIAPLGDLPEDLRRSVTAANGNPFEFHAIPRDHYEQLLDLCSHGKEFFIADEGLGFQLGLFVTG